MLPPKPNKRITFQVRPTQPRARHMEKGYAMVVDYMDMSGPCVLKRVGSTSVKWPNKRPQTSWPTKRKVMDKALVSCARSCGIQPRNTKCTRGQEKKPKLQQEDAMDAMRWATRLIDVHTSKASIEQTKVAYAMLVKERGI